MLKIAVCDDEIVFGKNVLEYIEQYMEKRQIPYKIQFFDSGKKFVALKEKMQEYAIVFLDINMEEMNGIETAKCMRAYCPDTFLVFVTAFIHYTLEGYKVEAIRYILKDMATFEQSMQECLDTILKKMKKAFMTLWRGKRKFLQIKFAILKAIYINLLFF